MIDEQEPPEAVVVRRARRWPDPIWAIPIVALLIGAWMAFHAIRAQGPRITISFHDARWLAAGKTKVKYRDIDVGSVRAIGFSRDRHRVIVTVELRRDAEPWLVEDTHFWIVEPRVGFGEISGLQTLISGAYIALDVGASAVSRRNFEGLDVAPVVTSEVPGQTFVVRGARAVPVGAPVFLHHLKVGQVTRSELEAEGNDVVVDLFVNAPYDRYVTTATRFWDASGIRGSVDANGVRVESDSVVSLIWGGISFETPADASDARPVPADDVFELFPSRDEAMKQPAGVREDYQFLFHQSVRGLIVGAPVDFRGILLGEVTRIGLASEPDRGDVSTVVDVRLYPHLLEVRMSPADSAETRVGLSLGLKRLVDHGLRAQLRPANLLTGQLFVALDFFPSARRVAFDPTVSPRRIPTVPSDVEDLWTSVTSIVHKIDRLPVGDVGRMATDARQLMAKAGVAIDRADAVVSEFRPTAPRGADVDDAVRQISQAARSVRSLSDTLERHPESLIRGRK
jgi:paraquat-inducible protein B